MPLTSVNCCKGGPCSPQECLDHAATRNNTCPFTYELLASMYATVQDRGDRLSTTALTGKCWRSEYLQRTEDYEVEPQDLYAAFRGTMFHGQLEKHVKGGSISEARYIADLEGLGPVSGSPDLVDPVVGELYDYKFSKEVPRYNYPWKDHIEQVNINRWLVDHAHTVEYGGVKYDLSSESVRRRFVPVDWRALILVYMDDKGPKPLPVTRSEQVPKASGEGTKAARVPDVWADDKVEPIIRERYEERQRSLLERTLPPIPEGYEAQQHPLCGYCPKRARCRELELEELIAERLDV